MAVKKQIAESVKDRADNLQTDAEVVAYLRELKHPLKREIAAVRETTLGVSPKIREGIKWKVPSFRTTEYFATFHVRSKESVQLVFHRGAKLRNDLTKEMNIPGPGGLIRWLGKDRCMVKLGAGKDIEANRSALRRIVNEWIRYI